MLTGFAKSDQRFSNFGPNMATYWPICCQMFTMCLYFRLYFVRSHDFSSYSMCFFVIYFSKHAGLKFKTNSSAFSLRPGAVASFARDRAARQRYDPFGLDGAALDGAPVDGEAPGAGGGCEQEELAFGKLAN